MNKLKAYTIMEMIVTMLIAGITISMAYSSYKIISGQFGQYKTNSQRNYDLILFDKLLLKDFINSNQVIRQSNGVKCVYNDKAIEYLFENIYVIRKSEITDTFKIVISNPKFYFLNEDNFVPEVLIDKVEFDGIIGNDTLPFVYKKQYGADVLIEKEREEEPIQ
jgi:hypothetical protein